MSARTSNNAVCILAICGITVGLLFIRVIILRVLEMVMTDEIRDSKTVTAMLKYAWLRQRGEG